MRVVDGGAPNDEVSRLAVPFRSDEGGRAPKLKKYTQFTINREGSSFYNVKLNTTFSRRTCN